MGNTELIPGYEQMDDDTKGCLGCVITMLLLNVLVLLIGCFAWSWRWMMHQWGY